MNRYSSRLASAVDLICYAVTYSWLFLLSSLVCCYLRTTNEGSLRKVFHYVILGPVIASLVITFAPVFLVGQLGWTILCQATRGQRKDYRHLSYDTPQEDLRSLREKNHYTFATANLLLGLDVLGKFQNMPSSLSRLAGIKKSFDRFGDPLRNLQALENVKRVGKDLSVSSTWPDIDFLLAQEVWDRPTYHSLVWKLRPRFTHFLVDVSRQSWKNNFCTGGSGLMLASRYPIVAADYLPFENKKSNWQSLISYGCIMAKVDLDMGQVIGADRKRRIGFLANLHIMAYQEKENQIGIAMTNAQAAFNGFRKANTRAEDEEVQFAAIGGDFNFDNISPGDSENHNHPIFRQYKDVCMKEAGCDKDWAIGTELRQLKIYDHVHDSPENFKAALTDDVQRRLYVIDADVVVQTMDLMYCDPKPDSDGNIRASPNGGLRRIDRILLDQSCPTSPSGVAFISALAGLTDHIPFSVTVSSSSD